MKQSCLFEMALKELRKEFDGLVVAADWNAPYSQIEVSFSGNSFNDKYSFVSDVGNNPWGIIGLLRTRGLLKEDHIDRLGVIRLLNEGAGEYTRAFIFNADGTEKIIGRSHVFQGDLAIKINLHEKDQDRAQEFNNDLNDRFSMDGFHNVKISFDNGLPVTVYITDASGRYMECDSLINKVKGLLSKYVQERNDLKA